MLHFSPITEPSAVEPVAVMSGGGHVTVRLALGDAGEGVTLRMDQRAAHLLAAMLAAGPAAVGDAGGGGRRGLISAPRAPAPPLRP